MSIELWKIDKAEDALRSAESALDRLGDRRSDLARAEARAECAESINSAAGALVAAVTTDADWHREQRDQLLALKSQTETFQADLTDLLQKCKTNVGGLWKFLEETKNSENSTVDLKAATRKIKNFRGLLLRLHQMLCSGDPMPVLERATAIAGTVAERATAEEERCASVEAWLDEAQSTKLSADDAVAQAEEVRIEAVTKEGIAATEFEGARADAEEKLLSIKSRLPQRVARVESVELDLMESDPPQLSITASGVVNTGGWKNATLEQRVYIRPPADGVYEFDFVAVPPRPGDPVTQAESSVVAELRLTNIPPDLKGVRVHARDNDEEKMLYSKLRADWQAVRKRYRNSDADKIFKIRTSFKPADTVLQRAFEKLEREAQINVEELKNTINDEGLTSLISEVTERLNRLRLKPVRKSVLHMTYPKLVEKLVSELVDTAAKRHRLPSEVATDADAQVAKILGALESELDKTANRVARDVLESNRVAVKKQDPQYQLLVERVRATL